MKLIFAVISFLFCTLQYQLWFANGGIVSAIQLHHEVQAVKDTHQMLIKRNQVLRADIEDLKHGREAVESRARYDLGMVKKGEVFYQITVPT